MTAQIVTNDSTQTIEEVVVKGFRIPGNVLASTPIQTLSHTDMERLGIHDMGDALKRFAGCTGEGLWRCRRYEDG